MDVRWPIAKLVVTWSRRAKRLVAWNLPVWIVEKDGGTVLLDATPRPRVIDVDTGHEVCTVHVSVHPRDLPVHSSEPVILLETFPEKARGYRPVL